MPDQLVRRKLAQEYLTDHTVSIAEVAFLFGISDQSSFNQAFRRWPESRRRSIRRRAGTATGSRA